MVKRDYIADIEKSLKEGKKPIEVLNVILGFLNFKSVEIRIYNILLKKPLTIKQLEEHLNLSERTIRKYIKRLDSEGFITKKVEQGKRLRYVYSAVPIRETWEKVKDKIERILIDITKVLETKTMSF
ncbi:MAG: HTH domain-containing protein [Thermoplasmata archaeon]|nr:HTH domain-containing protein [Thermoplasmata archaeon]